jgi:hypothetical protein
MLEVEAIPQSVHFLRDAAEKLLLSVQRKHVIFLAQVPCDVLSGEEVFLTGFCFLVAFQRRVNGLFWCKTWQECLDAVIFVVIGELSEFLC